MRPAAPDAAVRARLQDGDANGAAEHALRALGPGVYRYLASVLGDDDEAADAFSAFAEKVWAGLPAFRGECALRTWALRLASNVAADARGEACRRRRRPLPSSRASALAAEVRTCTAIVRTRQRAALERLRRRLLPDEQALLALRIDQELSWAEVGEVLSTPGAPVGADAAEKRFDRLRAKLARMAREEGLLE